MKISLCLKQNPFLPLPAAPGNKQQERTNNIADIWVIGKCGVAKVGVSHSEPLRGAGRGLSPAQALGELGNGTELLG